MSKNPVDIKLECGVENSEGAIFVKLKTLGELKEFWLENKEKYFYAAEGIGLNCGQVFLNEYEWVFGITKDSVVKMLFRWDEIGIECEFYEWSKEEPEKYKLWALEMIKIREDSIKDGSWSDIEERNYQEYKNEIISGYSGWWKIKKITPGLDFDELSNPYGIGCNVKDKYLSVEEASKRIQIRTYDENKEEGWGDVKFHDRESVEKGIKYWESVKEEGEGYYGYENEVG